MKRFLAAALAAGAVACFAQAVTLQGMLGHKALVVVNGGTPHAIAPGETWNDIKVLSTSGDEAVVEIQGQRQTLRLGEAPVSLGVPASAASAPATGSKIVLTAGSGGHFTTPGFINGKSVQFLVDTGATGVGLSVADAERIGLNYKAGQEIRLNTANGPAKGWQLKLASVRVGDVEVYDVEASVSPGAMPYVLLGNSFLNRFQLRRENDQMVLERRY